jgi:hypothetical protein
MTDLFSPYLLDSSIYVAEQGELTPVKGTRCDLVNEATGSLEDE